MELVKWLPDGPYRQVYAYIFEDVLTEMQGDAKYGVEKWRNASPQLMDVGKECGSLQFPNDFEEFVEDHMRDSWIMKDCPNCKEYNFPCRNCGKYVYGGNIPIELFNLTYE